MVVQSFTIHSRFLRESTQGKKKSTMASLIAPDNHVPSEDAEALYKACKGTSLSFSFII